MKPRALAAVMLLAACTHGEPFRVDYYGTSDPLPANPKRLTFSVYSDSEASWLPDGSAIIYSAFRPDFTDPTTCLELMRPVGGAAVRSLCPLHLERPDSTRAFQAAAVSRGGQIVYLRSARARSDMGWSVRQLVLGRLDGTLAPHVVLNGPFPQFNGITEIGWLDESHLVFRADQYYLYFPCVGCDPIESDSALFIATLALQGDSAIVTPVPGTTGPASVTVADSDAIFYALHNDVRLYRRQLSTGAVSVVWDFGNLTPTSLQYQGTRMAALANGVMTIIDFDSMKVFRPDTTAHYDGLALSPDGKRLVAHVNGDLWEYTIP